MDEKNFHAVEGLNLYCGCPKGHPALDQIDPTQGAPFGLSTDSGRRLSDYRHADQAQRPIGE